MRIVRAKGKVHKFVEMESMSPGANPLDNSSDSLSELAVRERLPDREILQLSFELEQSPDDPRFWELLNNLSRW